MNRQTDQQSKILKSPEIDASINENSVSDKGGILKHWDKNGFF